MAQVVIMMGSKSDEEKVSPCVDVLRSLGISYLCLLYTSPSPRD